MWMYLRGLWQTVAWNHCLAYLDKKLKLGLILFQVSINPFKKANFPKTTICPPGQELFPLLFPAKRFLYLAIKRQARTAQEGSMMIFIPFNRSSAWRLWSVGLSPKVYLKHYFWISSKFRNTQRGQKAVCTWFGISLRNDSTSWKRAVSVISTSRLSSPSLRSLDPMMRLAGQFP